MTQPPEGLPPYGWAPPPPSWAAPPQPPPRAGATADQILSWILWSLLLLFSIVFGVFAIFLVFDGGGCSTGDNRVCEADDFFGWLLLYWAALFVSAVGGLIGMIVSAVRQRYLWPWSVGAAVASAIITVVFYSLQTT